MSFMEKKISQTLIKKQLRRKTNPDLSQTISLARKEKAWVAVSKKLSGPTKKQLSVNLSDLDKFKEGETIAVAGKILSSGSLSKKLKIAALSISELAKEKLKGSFLLGNQSLDEILQRKIQLISYGISPISEIDLISECNNLFFEIELK